MKSNYYICSGKTRGTYPDFGYVIGDGLMFMTHPPTHKNGVKYTKEKSNSILKFKDIDDLVDWYFGSYKTDLSSLANDFLQNHSVLCRVAGADEYTVVDEYEIEKSIDCISHITKKDDGAYSLLYRFDDAFIDTFEYITDNIYTGEELFSSTKDIEESLLLSKSSITDKKIHKEIDKALSGLLKLGKVESDYILETLNEIIRENKGARDLGLYVTNTIKEKYPTAKLHTLRIRKTEDGDLEIKTTINGEEVTTTHNGDIDSFIEEMSKIVDDSVNNRITCVCGTDKHVDDWHNTEKCDCGLNVKKEDPETRMILDELGYVRQYGSTGSFHDDGIWFLSDDDIIVLTDIMKDRDNHYLNKFTSMDMTKKLDERITFTTNGLIDDIVMGGLLNEIYFKYCEWVMFGNIYIHNEENNGIYELMSNEYIRLNQYQTVLDWLDDGLSGRKYENRRSDFDYQKNIDIIEDMISTGISKIYSTTYKEITSEIDNEMGHVMDDVLLYVRDQMALSESIITWATHGKPILDILLKHKADYELEMENTNAAILESERCWNKHFPNLDTTKRMTVSKSNEFLTELKSKRDGITDNERYHMLNIVPDCFSNKMVSKITKALKYGL